MKAAESMAIKFALDRYQRGDVKVNAVHEMMEHLSRQMDTLRQILRVQEEKMSKAGILVESHADILDRMFWAEIPEQGKKSVLLSNEAACVPPRNIRQFVELLFEREDDELAGKILPNYCGASKRKRAIRAARRRPDWRNSPIFTPSAGARDDGRHRYARRENRPRTRSGNPEHDERFITRFGQEACSRKKYKAIAALCSSFERVAQERPALAQDLRSRVGIENRLPEMIEEAINSEVVPEDIVEVLQELPKSSVEHLADRFFRSQKRDECDRIIEFVSELGQTGLHGSARDIEDGQPRQAACGGWTAEPPEPEVVAGIAARPHERIQSFLPGHHRPPDRLRGQRR